MPPRKRPSSKTNNPPPLPSPQIDLVTLQAAITAAVTTAMSQRNPGSLGGGPQHQNQEDNQGHRKKGSYKDFMSAKPTSLMALEVSFSSPNGSRRSNPSLKFVHAQNLTN